jgi:hypothetical protein
MSARFPTRLKVRGLFAAPVRLAVALTMACLVAGCEEEWDPQPVKASQSVIRFAHTDFDPDLAEYSVQRYDNGGQVHLAQFSGADGFAVLVVQKLPPGYVMRTRSVDSEVSRLLNGVEVDWGAAGRTPSGRGYAEYRMFRLVDQPFNCVGFSDTFNDMNDGAGWKRKLVIGYFCYDESRPLSQEAAAELIRQVSVR